MDWTRLVSNLLKMIAKKLPRDCMLQVYMFASLTHAVPASRQVASPITRKSAGGASRRSPDFRPICRRTWGIQGGRLASSEFWRTYLFFCARFLVSFVSVHVRILSHAMGPPQDSQKCIVERILAVPAGADVKSARLHHVPDPLDQPALCRALRISVLRPRSKS